MFFKQCLNRNITHIMNSQLNSFRNINTNTNISNEVLDKKLDYIIDSVISFGAGYETTFLFDKLILNK